MNDLKINIEELDKEWMMLPQIYGEYSERFEMTDMELRKEKMKLDFRRAEISKHIRENSKKYYHYGNSALCGRSGDRDHRFGCSAPQRRDEGPHHRS